MVVGQRTKWSYSCPKRRPRLLLVVCTSHLRSAQWLFARTVLTQALALALVLAVVKAPRAALGLTMARIPTKAALEARAPTAAAMAALALDPRWAATTRWRRSVGSLWRSSTAARPSRPSTVVRAATARTLVCPRKSCNVWAVRPRARSRTYSGPSIKWPTLWILHFFFSGLCTSRFDVGCLSLPFVSFDL